MEMTLQGAQLVHSGHEKEKAELLRIVKQLRVIA